MPGFCAAETIPNSIVSLILFFSRLFFFHVQYGKVLSTEKKLLLGSELTLDSVHHNSLT